MDQQECSATSIHHFFCLLVYRDSKRHKWRPVHRDGDALHSGGRRSVAIPAPLFGNEVYEEHLPIDFESHFIFLTYLNPKIRILFRRRLSRLYSRSMNSSTDTPACFSTPRSVPVASSECSGTTHPLT